MLMLGVLAAVFIANSVVYNRYVTAVKDTSGASVEPPGTLNTINTLCACVTGFAFVFSAWGFYKRGSYGYEGGEMLT